MRIVCAMLVAIAGCGSGRSNPDQEPARDARPGPIDALPRDASLEERMAALEPVVGPPPPTVKPGSKGDCRTEYAPRPNRDPNPMCAIKGGTFMMGDSNGPARKPVKTEVADFYIDQFEVTNAQAAHFLNAHGNSCGLLPCQQGADVRKEGEHWRPVPGMSRKPMRFDREGARYYCAWVGKRLPTEAEWEYAARHDPKTGRDYRYPWGDRWERGRADCDEDVCADGFSRSAPPDVGTFDGTDGHGDGSSPWGLHDTVGGLEERVDGCGPLDACVNCDFPDPTCPPLGKGGAAWSSPEESALTHRLDYGRGARCASSAPR